MIKCFAMFFVAITLLAAGGLWLHAKRMNSQAAGLEEISAGLESNRNYLNMLQEELDQLDWQLEVTHESLLIYHQYFDLCTTWKQEMIADYKAGFLVP